MYDICCFHSIISGILSCCQLAEAELFSTMIMLQCSPDPKTPSLAQNQPTRLLLPPRLQLSAV